MTFEEESLKKKTHKKRKKNWDNEKSKNKNNIVFLLLLDMRQRVVQSLVSYKFLNIFPVYHFLFYIISQSSFNSNVKQKFLWCQIPYFLTN